MARKKSRSQQAFELIVSTDAEKARLRLKKYSTDLKRLNRDEKSFVRAAQRRAAAVRAAGVPSPVLGVLPTARVTRSQKFFALGAEGVRIGHLRFNQAGRISLSERTLLGAGKAAGIAVGLQVLGSLGEASVRVRDEISRGRDPTKVVTKYAKEQAQRVITMFGDLFGITKISATVAAHIADVPFEDAMRAMGDLGIVLLGSEDAVIKRAAEIGAELAVIEGRNLALLLKHRRQVRAKNLERFPQDLQSQLEVIREDLAVRESDDRLMVRDVTNVPVWKRVNLAVNEGA